MRKTFAESFQEQLQIQEQIANKWGYYLPKDDLNISKASEKAQKNLFINRNINPRQTNKIKVQMSHHHQQLLKEMENNEFERQMRNRANRKNEQQFNVIKMLNERIREYNYLVDHKHIKNKNSDDTKRVLKMKPKTEAQLLLDEINMKNGELIATEDLGNQFKLNKKITSLYRQYKDKMYQDNTPGQKQRKKSLNQTQTLVVQKGRNNSFAHTKSKVKSSSNVLNDSEHYNGTKKSKFNIQQPYVPKAFINKSKEIQKNMMTQHQQLQVYKYKVSQVRAKSIEKQNRKKNKAKGISESFVTPRQTPTNQEFFDSDSPEKEFQRTRKQSADYCAINYLKQKKKQQQKYFSSYLEKRNRKFKKPWGNKILIKYDSHTQARQMLQGSSMNPTPDVTTTDFFPNSTKKLSNYKINPKQISQDDRAVYQSMIEQQNDENLYQIMCKNEKVNLYLKARKKD